MAKLIEEPRDDMADLDDWQKFLYRTTRQGGGFICIGLTNMDSGARPQIAAGSRLEINGAVFQAYEADGDESIAEEPSGSGRQYVYAVPSSEGDDGGRVCSFLFRPDKPEWSAAKGGWYKGNDRAVAKLDYFADGSQYNYKVILDSYNAMWLADGPQPIPETGGVLVAEAEEGDINKEKTYYLPAGAYRYELKGGKGGKGSDGNGGSENAGGDGVSGEMKRGTFHLASGQRFILSRGGDGENGGNAVTAGGGGGGCSGGASYIRSDHDQTKIEIAGRRTMDEFVLVDYAVGGSGGGGGGGHWSGSNGAGGGGGGGGYGVGNAGKDFPGRAGGGGANGRGGVGGDGGTNGGGGGSGIAEGGEGGFSSSYPITSGYRGKDGGGYGEAGGSGANGGSAGSNPSYPGKGGASRKLYLPGLGFGNAYQGGGSGGSASVGSSKGGDGGGGLLETSDGYARIYQMWLV